MALDRSNHPEYSFSPNAVMLMGYTSAEAKCKCGRRYYAGEGDRLPCSHEWCPYCEGVEEGRRDLDVERRRFAATVTQLTEDRRLATEQLELRDRLVRAVEAARDVALDECVNLTRQRDLARADLAEAEERATALLQRLANAADEVVRLRDTQAAARTFAGKAFLALIALFGVSAWAWLWWDSLPALGRYWRGLLECVGVLGALLVLPRWRRVRDEREPIRMKEKLTGVSPGSRRAKHGVTTSRGASLGL